ncbi:MAG: dihydroorotate dehydrogenase-like protein [Deferrisomatales bacterium]
MDTRTRFYGLDLSHPVIPGASPLADALDKARRLEDAGAPAVVLPSLFEEEIEAERLSHERDVERPTESFPEALTYFPKAETEWIPGPDTYLERLRQVKEALGIPVVASLNGVSAGGWTDYARQIEQAGADALELNVYFLAADPDEGPQAVDERVVEVVRRTAQAVTLPVAVKLSPFFSSLPHLVRRLGEAGARGVIVFNRFYQPDVDPEALEVVPRLRLSDSSELGLRLRWLALLSGRVSVELAACGGVHSADDVVKALLAGAHAVQMVSALLQRGPEHLGATVEGLRRWMENHGYESVGAMRGVMDLARCPNPAALVRGNYARVLRSGPGGGS